jgi:myo-inositol 2-dehydrogenase/D-chiro-inositol 1-dehydrogenase
VISVGLIGCGEVAESGHLPTILKNDRFRLAAVCDVDAARTELFSQRGGGVPQYANWRELLTRERDLDAVVLALPPEISPDVVVEALRLNLAVLDEKPIAASVAEGRRLLQAVEEYRGIYQIGFVLRYGDWVEHIRQLAPSLGSPLQINVEVYDERYNPDDAAHLARIQSFIRNSSAMTHEGSHVIDYVSLWNQSPWRTVSSVAQQTSPSFSGPNLWNSRIEFDDQTTLDVRVAWLLSELPPSTVTINGSEGRIDFNCATGRGHVELCGVEQPFSLAPLAPHWERQYQAFANAIDRGAADLATVSDGVRALEVTAACELSAKTGLAVTPESLAAALGMGRAVQRPPQFTPLPAGPAG